MNIKLIATGSSHLNFLTGQWGLSMLVSKSVLFDTFCSYNALIKKLKKAGNSIDDIQSVVISHDHPKHIGGLWGLIKNIRNLNVYLPIHADEQTKKRVINEGGILKEGPAVRLVRPGVYVTEDFVGAVDGKPMAEQAIAIETVRGMILLFGSARPGVGAFIQRANAVFGKPVHGIIGGLHLPLLKHEDVLHQAIGIKGEGIDMIAPLHATNMRSFKEFRDIFREDYVEFVEGDELMLT